MKIRNHLILLIIALLCSAPICAQTVDDDSDIVAWSDATFIVPLRKKEEKGKTVDQWTMNVSGVFRMGRNLKRPIDERASVSLNYRINRYFTAGSGYVYRRFRLNEAPRQYEHRALFFLLAEKKWTPVTLRNRSMVTYFIKHSRPDTVGYRNRVQVGFPVRKKGKELFMPFIMDEFFYGITEKRWTRNDFFAGVSKQFTPKFGADFFYLRQGLTSGTPRQTNGFGASFRYRLDFIK